MKEFETQDRRKPSYNKFALSRIARIETYYHPTPYPLILSFFLSKTTVPRFSVSYCVFRDTCRYCLIFTKQVDCTTVLSITQQRCDRTKR